MIDEVYWGLVVACVLGIVFSSVFVYLMGDRVSESEAFTALYFNEPGDLPSDLVVNGSSCFSFSVENHNLNFSRYVLEVDSEVESYKSNFSLLPGARADFGLCLRPLDHGWRVLSNSSVLFDDRVSLLSESSLGEVSDLRLVSDNASSGGVLPLSYEISRFGSTLQYNLSVDSLNDSLDSFHRMESVQKDRSVVYERNLSLYSVEGILFLRCLESHSLSLSRREPFVVKLYEVGEPRSESQEIHFWYEVS